MWAYPISWLIVGRLFVELGEAADNEGEEHATPCPGLTEGVSFRHTSMNRAPCETADRDAMDYLDFHCLRRCGGLKLPFRWKEERTYAWLRT